MKPVGRGGGGLVEVGVGEHDVGALAAELQGQRDEAVGREVRERPAHLHGAGERDLAHVRVVHERRAGGEPPPRTTFRRRRGCPRALASSPSRIDAGGRQRRRLEHDRVAGGDGRGAGAGGLVDRQVPGRDHADHAERLVAGERVEVAPRSMVSPPAALMTSP